MPEWLRTRGAGQAPRFTSLAVPEPLSGWLNFAAALATLGSIVASVFIVKAPERVHWYFVVPLAYICVLATAALVLLAYQQIVFDRHRRYVLAVPTLQGALRVLVEATYAVMDGSVDEKSFRRSLRDAVSQLAAAFTQITGTRCRVAIKTVSVVPEALGKPRLGPDDFAVTTLCRSDSDHRDRRRPQPDLVAKNTDFRVIFQGEPYYFNNDLVAAARRFEYENSHWDPSAIRSGRVDYRASIIWPVTPVELDDVFDGNPPVIGFVCLDSAVRNVFDERFDVSLGQTFTHAVNLALWMLDRARRAPDVPPDTGHADENSAARGSRGAPTPRKTRPRPRPAP